MSAMYFSLYILRLLDLYSGGPSNPSHTLIENCPFFTSVSWAYGAIKFNSPDFDNTESLLIHVLLSLHIKRKQTQRGALLLHLIEILQIAATFFLFF